MPRRSSDPAYASFTHLFWDHFKWPICSFRTCFTLEVFTRAAIESILGNQIGRAASVGGTRRRMSPRQLKEVIQVAHTNVGSVASLGALVGSEVRR